MQEETLEDFVLDGEGTFLIEDAGESTADAEVVLREVNVPKHPAISFSEAFVQKSITYTAEKAKKVGEYHRVHPYRTVAAAAVGGLFIGLLLGTIRRQ